MIPTIDVNALLNSMLNQPLVFGLIALIFIVGISIVWLAGRKNGYLGTALAVVFMLAAWWYATTHL